MQDAAQWNVTSVIVSAYFSAHLPCRYARQDVVVDTGHRGKGTVAPCHVSWIEGGGCGGHGDMVVITWKHPVSSESGHV